MSSKMHIRGNLQVDGALLGKDGNPSGGGAGLVVGDWVTRTDMADYDLDLANELIPIVVNKPFIVQVELHAGTIDSMVALDSYNKRGLVAVNCRHMEGAQMMYGLSLIMAPNESYQIVRFYGDPIIFRVSERPLA